MRKSPKPAVTAADLIARREQEYQARKKPELHIKEAPDGYRLKGVSTFVNAQGEVVGQWIKTAKEPDPEFAILESFERTIAERKIPVLKTVKKPKTETDDLLCVYPLGDPHLGMLSWHAETGEDFDHHIAKRNLSSAMRKLVGLAPPSKQCLIVDLGDFFHSDNMDSVTARSGHHLDTDSRWAKILDVGIDCCIELIDCALLKHETVWVIIEIGNHDDHTALFLSALLARYYANNPRVKIDRSPATFHYFEFGQNLIGVTHGNNVKLAALPGIMAHDRAEAWGRTKHRVWYTGHVHHTSVQEFTGCTAETFRTLAARDAWHHSKGYRSGRSMPCIVLHKEHGEILRHTVGISMLEKP